MLCLAFDYLLLVSPVIDDTLSRARILNIVETTQSPVRPEDE